MITNAITIALPANTPLWIEVAAETAPIQSGLGVLLPANTTLTFTVTNRIYEATPLASPVNTAHVCVLGDRCGGFVPATGAAVDAAILSATGDCVNVVCTGDLADASTTYETINDSLKAALTARGGKMYPTMGNHDYDGARETEQPIYFGTAGYNGGKSYYSRVLGNIEFFFLNDNPEELDAANGINGSLSAFQASAEGVWLLAALAASQATWKIVVTHHTVYSSSSAGGGYAALRWNWAALGVHAVIQGHAHGLERIYKDGLYFFTCAMGGDGHHGWGTALAETKWRETNTSLSGYLKISDSAGDLQFEFYDTGNNRLDACRIAVQPDGPEFVPVTTAPGFSPFHGFGR
jgi:hypothetical protein